MYLDLVMLLNFLVDFFLLLGTNRLAGFPSDYKRVVSAALLGGIYSGGCMLRGFRFLGAYHWRAIILVLMAVIAFGWNRGTIKRCGIFLLLSMALGGAVELLGSGDGKGVFLSAVGIFLLCCLAFGGGSIGQEFFPVEIVNGGNRVNLIALRDTGNCLRDPVTGEQVLIIGDVQAQKLTGLTHGELCDPLQTICRKRMPGLRLVPYRTVGRNQGVMLAMRFDQVKLNGKERPTIVAFAPEGLGAGTYQALAGGKM